MRTAPTRTSDLGRHAGSQRGPLPLPRRPALPNVHTRVIRGALRPEYSPALLKLQRVPTSLVIKVKALTRILKARGPPAVCSCHTGLPTIPWTHLPDHPPHPRRSAWPTPSPPPSLHVKFTVPMRPPLCPSYPCNLTPGPGTPDASDSAPQHSPPPRVLHNSLRTVRIVCFPHRKCKFHKGGELRPR